MHIQIFMQIHTHTPVFKYICTCRNICKHTRPNTHLLTHTHHTVGGRVTGCVSKYFQKSLYTYICAHIHICIYVHIHIYIHTQAAGVLQKHVRQWFRKMFLYIYICIYIYIYIYIYMYIYVYVYIYMNINIYTYIYMKYLRAAPNCSCRSPCIV